MSWEVEVGSERRERDEVHVAVTVGDRSFDVTVKDHDATALAAGAGVPTLVRESFRFLLEREPLEAILTRFDLSVIERYFPGYRREIARRLGGTG